MTSGTHSDLERVRASKFKRVHNIIGVRATRNQAWTPVGAWIDARDHTHSVVADIIRKDDTPGKMTPKSSERIWPTSRPN